MAQYLLIESRDPFESNDVGYYYELAKALVEGGNQVTLFLVQNGVLPARPSAHSAALSALARSGVTVLAGLLFIINPETQFFPTVWPIVGWLVLRSLILGYASTHAHGSVRTWMGLSAGMDFLLAILVIAGLSIAAIVVSIFGPTPPLIASFSWLLAASFVVNGLMLLEVASCEREGTS